jgi:hypothetical protein
MSRFLIKFGPNEKIVVGDNIPNPVEISITKTHTGDIVIFAYGDVYLERKFVREITVHPGDMVIIRNT